MLATHGHARGTAARRLKKRVDLVTLLTWTIREQKGERSDVALFDVELAAISASMGWEPRACSTDGIAAIERQGLYGRPIDGGGAIRGVPPRLHPDAETVVGALDRLGPSARLAIVKQARLGGAAEWLDPRARRLVQVAVPPDRPGRVRHKVESWWELTPKRSELARRYTGAGVSLIDAAGRRRIEEEEKGFRFRVLGDGTREVAAKWCPLRLTPSDDKIRLTNQAYTVWHRAMAALLRELDFAALEDHVLIGIGAPARPWE